MKLKQFFFIKNSMSSQEEQEGKIIYSLTPYEKDEIKIYEGYIYYDGNKCMEKLALKDLKSCEDEDGRYIVYIGDHIRYRYEIIKKIGNGSFSDVYMVMDHKEKILKALKIIRSEYRFLAHAETEKNILLKISAQKVSNVGKILEGFMFRSHPCFVFDLYDVNLYQYIKKNNYLGLKVGTIKNIIKQILECLVGIHKLKIIHGDLKPENIVFADKENQQIKIIDFGSSNYVGKLTSNYIQSRYYRSPEIVLDLKYDTKIDIWSFGCIAVELLIGKPLFPASNEQYLIFHICKYLGVPPLPFLRKTKRYSRYFGPDGFLMNSEKRLIPGSSSINRIVSVYCPKLADLIDKCLKWDPEDRITAEEALRHVFF